MAREITSEQILERYSKYKQPIGKVLQSYLVDKNLAAVENISLAGGVAAYGHEMVRAAINERAATTVSNAFFEIMTHRIVKQSPDSFDDLSMRFADACTNHKEFDSGMEELLFNRIASYELDDFSMALMWVSLKSDGYAAFDWRSAPDHDRSNEKQYEWVILPDNITAVNSFEEIILQLSDDQMIELFLSYKRMPVKYNRLIWNAGPLQGIIARYRPQIIERLLTTPEAADYTAELFSWPYIVGATNAFDAECLKRRGDSVFIFMLDGLRNGQYSEEAQTWAIKQPMTDYNHALKYLAESAPQLMLKKLGEWDIAEVIADSFQRNYYTPCFRIAVENWDKGGRAVFDNVSNLKSLDNMPEHSGGIVDLMVQGVIDAGPQATAAAQQWVRDLYKRFPGPLDEKYKWRWGRLVREAPRLIEQELWQFLQHEKKVVRSLAIEGLGQAEKKASIEKVFDKACALLKNDNQTARLGAVELLTVIGGDVVVAALQKSANEHQRAPVLKAIHKSLEKLGAPVRAKAPEDNQSLAEILAEYERKKKSIKLPSSASWLDVSALPALVTKEGDTLPDLAVLSVIVKQYRHKNIEAAPDNLAILSHIDREKSGDFALALLQQWMKSRQQASERWALALSGLLGDQRILLALTDPIDGWARNARHKLAEYAARAVALVPSDEAMMLLDTLANRYRRKYRNIGRACQQALEAAAVSQGVSMDELEDLIVPTLGFSAEYQRALSDTETLAVLQPDFKLMFLDPKTELQTKSPPASLPPATKGELAVLRKLIRETSKGQTARLERALVCQRSWSARRWSELFEINPFLQAYASQLVWCTLDGNGNPNQYFRRYPNGLLANAAGEMIELEDKDNLIVIAHPLSMDEDSLQNWKEHLVRMKITPPFVQLDRPVVRLDPAHRNRRTLALADGQQVASGTFRSRSEKLGWTRGSMSDGGTIVTCYKNYIGTSISVTLALEDYYVGQSPDDMMVLGTAMFMRGEAELVRSYIRDEAHKPEHERVLAFGDVPAVVYSETMVDLQTMIT